MVNLDDVKNLKVSELKQELKILGLSQAGKKDDLTRRLELALEAAGDDKPAAANESAEAPTKVDGADGKVPIEFKANTGTEQLPAATGLEDPADPPAEKPVEAKPVTGLTEEEKAKQRAERFGIVSEKDKMAARAKRFGVESKVGNGGAAVAATDGISKVGKVEDIAKRKERAKRFNLPEPVTSEEAESKKKARLERFGSGSEKKQDDDPAALASRLAARAERFALSKPGTQTAADRPGAQKEAGPQAKAVKANTTAQERDAAAIAKAAALVKPAANPEAEAKRQARAIRFQAS